MKRDLRDDPVYREVLEHFRRIHEPNAGAIGDALDVRVSHDGRYVAVAGSVYEPLSGPPHQRIALYDTSDCTMKLIPGAANDAVPRWSPQRHQLAFLSDRAVGGTMRVHVYDPVSAAVLPHATALAEPAESIAWSPDGKQLLVQSVAPGADRAGALGSGTVAADDGLPGWMAQDESARTGGWRRLWICSADDVLQACGAKNLSFWEAAWCGNDGVVAIASDDPREGAWHDARLVYISIATGRCETIYRPAEEIGVPIATDDGRYVALIEGCCSDRTVVAGEVLIFDRSAGWTSRRVDGVDADVTSLAVRDGDNLSFSGLRGFEVVAGEIEASSARASFSYAANESWLRRYPGVTPVGESSYVTVAHSYGVPPRLVRFASGVPPATLYDFANEGTRYIAAIAGEMEAVTWSARDGLEIQGYLAHPTSPGPHPLVVAVHGGPVWAFTNAWQIFGQLTPLLVSRGYAVLHPNPRGSSGRGQAFARMVRGELGGEERYDILAGAEKLVRDGAADPHRLAIMGASHGGYMSAWMVTQTDIFAAAIAVAPVTDWVSCHFTASDPEFDRIFVGGDPYDAGSKYFTRSPIMFARNVKTPTLLIAGGQDRCTPMGQAIEFHRALIENGIESELAIYPREGHGVREFESMVDYATRVVQWLDAHLKVPAPARVFERSV